MLNSRSLRGTCAPVRGFTLIELMVSITLGLIVAAGAVSLIVAINQANSETIQSTRLTQELRSLASVIADDIKRTRRVDDPIAMIGQGAAVACPTTPTIPKTPAQPCYTITTSTAGCVAYGYTGTIGSASIYNYHSIRRASGAVVLDQLTFDPNVAAGTNLPVNAAVLGSGDTACPITGSNVTTPLSSPQINITALTFTAVGAGEIDLTVTGQFLAGDAYTNARTRTFTQPIFIRSNSAN